MTRDSDKPKPQASKGSDIQKAAREYLKMLRKSNRNLRCESSRVGRRHEAAQLICAPK